MIAALLGAWAFVHFFGLCLCIAAGRADEAMGAK